MPLLILQEPIFSEKAVNAATYGFYTFKVLRTANKFQIKRAIEEQFDVKVESVKTQNYKPEAKRRGRFTGKTKAFKKAIVKLKEGSIDLWVPPETKETKGKKETKETKAKKEGKLNK